MELGINLVTPARYRDATDSGGSCVMVGSMALIDEIFKGNLAAGLVMDVGAPRSMTDLIAEAGAELYQDAWAPSNGVPAQATEHRASS